MKEYLKQSWVSPKVEVKSSPSHGKGLFAKELIDANEVVAIWGGNFMGETEVDQAKRQGKTIQRISKDVWEAFDYETRHEDPTYNHNHSCDPNTWMNDEVTISARKPILSGEELTINYAVFVIDDNFVIQDCKCGSNLCRHTITGNDWQIKALQDRYANHFTPFLLEKIQAIA